MTDIENGNTEDPAGGPKPPERMMEAEKLSTVSSEEDVEMQSVGGET